ncbi:hypothetical protein NPIL_122281, partial [Nephila pilipes]
GELVSSDLADLDQVVDLVSSLQSVSFSCSLFISMIRIRSVLIVERKKFAEIVLKSAVCSAAGIQINGKLALSEVEKVFMSGKSKEMS